MEVVFFLVILEEVIIYNPVFKINQNFATISLCFNLEFSSCFFSYFVKYITNKTTKFTLEDQDSFIFLKHLHFDYNWVTAHLD
jgi:hypothetical protein